MGFTAIGMEYLEDGGLAAFAAAVDGISVHTAEPVEGGDEHLAAAIVTESMTYNDGSDTATTDGGVQTDTNAGALYTVTHLGLYAGSTLLWFGLRRNAVGTAAETVDVGTGYYYPFSAGAITLTTGDLTDADLA